MLPLQSMLQERTIRDFSWTSQDVKHVESLLEKGVMDSLNSLCLYDSTYQGNSFTLLMQLLSNVPGFQALHLRMDQLSTATLDSIGTNLAAKHLSTLSFWLNEPLVQLNADKLVNILQLPNKELHFTFAPEQSGLYDYYPCLRVLQCHSNKLPPILGVVVSISNHAELEKFVHDACQTNVITHLTIDFELQPDSRMLDMLSYLIQHASKLLELDFIARSFSGQGINIESKAVEAFRHSLVCNTTLETLHLGHLGECPSIARNAVIPALQVNKTLLTIQIFFDEAEMELFFEALPNMKGLQRLESYWLGGPATSQCMEALENNDTLHDLWVLNEEAMTIDERIKVKNLTWRNYLLTQARKYAQTEREPAKVIETLGRLAQGNQDECFSSVYHLVRHALIMDLSSGHASASK